MTVLVGAASSTAATRMSLADAQTLRRDANAALKVGGVAIPSATAGARMSICAC